MQRIFIIESTLKIPLYSKRNPWLHIHEIYHNAKKQAEVNKRELSKKSTLADFINQKAI